MLLFKVRRLSLTLQCRAELFVDHETVADWSQFCRKAKSYFILSCSLQLFLWRGGGGGYGKYVEIGDSWFSRLCATAWVFVAVERELGTPVFHLSPIAPPDFARHH